MLIQMLKCYPIFIYEWQYLELMNLYNINMYLESVMNLTFINIKYIIYTFAVFQKHKLFIISCFQVKQAIISYVLTIFFFFFIYFLLWCLSGPDPWAPY